MYEQEYRTLISLIAPVVGGRGGACVASDDKTLYLLAKKHGVNNLLAYAWQSRTDLDPELKKALDGRLFNSLRQQMEQEREAILLGRLLREKGIRFLIMKGSVLRHLYPAPEMRISCDIDFFYDREHREEVDALMEARGYQKQLSDANHDEYMKPPFLSVEMHRNLLTDLPTIDAYYQNIWERLIPVNECEYRMTDEDFYIYQTVHTVKHFIAAGTGIRSVLDTFVYLRAKPELDLAYVEKELASIGLLAFHKKLVRLAEVWFAGAEESEELAEFSDYILGSGVYGVGVNAAANRSSSKGQLGSALSRAFPPYRLMAEKYPSLRRLPVLLPFYWIGRLFGALFGGRRARMNQEMRAIREVDAAHTARVGAVMDSVGLRDYR